MQVHRTSQLVAAILVVGLAAVATKAAFNHFRRDPSTPASQGEPSDALTVNAAAVNTANHFTEENAKVSILEQLKSDVSHLALPNGRPVGSPGHDTARAYLLERLQKLGLTPYAGNSFELPYEVDGQRFVNIIGVVTGTNPSLAPALLAAHYDTCGPYPGADDNAAAVSILLALAKRWRSAPLERTVVFAFFDAEEPPYFLRGAMGSIHFYNRQRTGPVHCAVVLDLVGHDFALPGLEDLVVVTGMESDPQFAEILKSCDGSAHIRTVATLNRYIGDLSDHRAFREDRRPYLFFTCAHWEHYHQPSDTPEKLNYDKMAALVEYLSKVTQLACASTLQGPFEGYDSTDAELYFLRRELGPIVKSMGLHLDNREDIGVVVGTLSKYVGL